MAREKKAKELKDKKEMQAKEAKEKREAEFKSRQEAQARAAAAAAAAAASATSAVSAGAAGAPSGMVAPGVRAACASGAAAGAGAGAGCNGGPSSAPVASAAARPPVKAAPVGQLRDMASLRTSQRAIVYVMGLSPRIAKEEILRRHEYFGQYGKIMRIQVSPAGAAATSGPPSLRCCFPLFPLGRLHP